MFDVLNGAINMMQKGPRPLEAALNASAVVNGDGTVSIDDLRSHLANAAAGDDTATIFRTALSRWDNEASNWTEGTERNSEARRELIYRLLKINDGWVKLCDDKYPFHRIEPPVVIAKEHERWYDEEVRNARNFYWTAYQRQLASQGWAHDSILQLDQSTTSIVERLTDPTRKEAFQAKGLVVGYVQSGKTANFTGVIAKAADAGYKLIIVLAGVLDVLRSQTQRRIDKELIGRELLDGEYSLDADWDRFLSHGTKPSALGSFDWYRLTGPEADYQRLARGVEALTFEAVNKTKPLYDKENLFKARTRIAIVKKNSKILQRLLTDLRSLSRAGHGAPLDQIPALIIDDESDQASINVSRKTSAGVEKERTSTNKAIVQLLKLLPRAQYVGYTATPFANVFVDPNNEEDIFPKDFLISLPRPNGYMGVRDFYDLEGSRDDNSSRPNERDYVRPVTGDHTLAKNLPEAIDSFVLSGAIKLFRTAIDPKLVYRHHTMLVHQSEKQAQHDQLATAVREIYGRAGYDAGEGLERLEHLFENDFKRVYAERGADLPFPETFDELMPYLGVCLNAIGDARSAVLIINNDNKDQTPDFDRQPVWKILVGGTKLSRGYTVEGLTVSYYRRRAQAADTLMQMGRWFGFRRGYRDLVRLYIGTQEPLGGRKPPINLYEAFGAVCRDEEAFRDELKRYASMEDPRILPSQIPPLVPSHMLRPTAPNKMYNAVVTYNNFGGRLSESTFAPSEPDDIRFNNLELERMIGAAKASTVELIARRGPLEADVVEISPKAMVRFLENYRWYNSKDRSKGSNPMQLQIEFLKKTGAQDPGIDDWLLLGPHIKQPRAFRSLAGKDFHVVNRTRQSAPYENRFNTYNDPIHRDFAKHISGQELLAEPNDALEELRKPRRGVIIYYPITETVKAKGTAKPPFTVGFTLLFPRNAISTPIKFTVKRSDLRDAAVVPSGTR